MMIQADGRAIFALNVAAREQVPDSCIILDKCFVAAYSFLKFGNRFLSTNLQQVLKV